MKRSIKMIADFWYSAWIDAGQPILNDLLDKPVEDLEEKFSSPSTPLNVREHEGLASKESQEELCRSFYRSMWRTGN
ncbi:hypothetical protein [Belliella filtrata]|uniref:hypothetical protein n=1 Tax=Belliella filtrata TaxID=2923435 RepID=UPI00374D4AD9